MKHPRNFLVAAICLIGAQVQAHEFWIEPLGYQVATGDTAQATFNVGQDFKGPSYSYIPGRSVRFDQVIGEQVAPVQALVGDNPAFSLADAPEGLLVVVHETGVSSLQYSEEGKFERFVTHKALETGGVTHTLPFVELYQRHAKALIGVGASQGQDRALGLRHEIVALANPYVDDLSDGLPVQVLYEGAPRAQAQVELFAKAPDGSVVVTLHTTDAEGIARLPLTTGHSYLADSVVLEPLVPAADGDPVWMTYWAALTFGAP